MLLPPLLRGQSPLVSRSDDWYPVNASRTSSDAFTACLLAANIQVSMDGRGRALDNVFCERLWRSVKCGNIYVNQYDTVRQLHTGLSAYFDFHNYWRLRQSHDYRTPAE